MTLTLLTTTDAFDIIRSKTNSYAPRQHGQARMY